MLYRCRRFAVPLLLLALLPAPAAAAAEDSPYHIDWPIDLSVIGGAASLWVFPSLIRREVVRPICPCKSSDLPGIDRYPVGRRSSLYDQLSNGFEAAFIVGPLVVNAYDIVKDTGRWAGVIEDSVVLAEVLVVNGALNQLVKLTIRRPRPTVYDVAPGDPAVADPGNYLSFYSGHASTAFAAAMAYATTFELRHPHDGLWCRLVYAAGAVTGGSVALFRVLAGEHFPTDVIAGAAVGSAIGLVLPRLHRRSSLVLSPTPGGVSLSGSF